MRAKRLDAGPALEQAVAETQKRTRRFAKRQLTWLRALEGVTWLNAEAADENEAIRFLLEKGLN